MSTHSLIGCGSDDPPRQHNVRLKKGSSVSSAPQILPFRYYIRQRATPHRFSAGPEPISQTSGGRRCQPITSADVAVCAEAAGAGLDPQHGHPRWRLKLTTVRVAPTQI
jgi:hypothetical protein